MPCQVVVPRIEVSPAGETPGSLACSLDVSLTLPFSPKGLVAYAAAPLAPNAASHGSALAATRFRGGGWLG